MSHSPTFYARGLLQEIYPCTGWSTLNSSNKLYCVCLQETKKKVKEVSEEKTLYKGEPEPPPV